MPEDSTILVVTHNLVIASVLCTISNKELKFFTDFTTESGSISEVSFLNGVLSLEAINFTDHLKVEDKIVRFSEG
ncbi:histidine phosphatase family protein [bacterium]|nr:histidine phosphatase family protein [bacterium]